MAQYLDKTGLTTLWNKIKNTFALKSHTHTKSQIKDFPTIPTVNNPTITINQGGTKKGSFSLNQSGATTIDLTDNNTTYTAGTGLSLSNGAFSVKTGYTTSGKNYKVSADSSGNLYVSVPWNNDTWRPVVDNLTTTDATKSLSANQGKVLKDLVDGKLNNYGTDTSRPNGTSFTFPGGSNPVQMRSGNKSAGADIGIFSLTDDNAFICNSSDNGYAFAVFDTDKTADFSTASNAAFAVLSEHAGVSIKGGLTVDGTSVSLNGHTHSQYLTAHQDISGKYNTSDLGNTTFKVTRGASQSTKNTGYWAGMLHSTQGGSPVLPSNGKWWHVISMDWTGTDTNNWISQLALPTQDGGVPHYRRNDGGGGVFIDNSTWHAFITDENIGSQNVNYANSAGSANSVAWGNVSGRPTSLPASDVYAWAKAATKPSYTKSEVGLGNVDNTADANKSVYYATSSHLLRTYSAGNGSHGADYYLKCRHNVDGNDRFKLQIIRSDGSVTHSTSVDYANSAGSVAWGNVSGRPSSLPASDVYSWAKASSKPSYSWSEITSKPNILPYTPLNGGLKTVTSTTTWGNQTGSETASFSDDAGGGLKFRKNCPSNGKMSMIIDGTVYVNEGANKVIDTSNISMSLSNGVLTITYNV